MPPSDPRGPQTPPGPRPWLPWWWLVVVVWTLVTYVLWR